MSLNEPVNQILQHCIHVTFQYSMICSVSLTAKRRGSTKISLTSLTCALPAPDSIPSSKKPDGRLKSRMEWESCKGGRKAVPTTRRLGVATPITEGAGVFSSEMVQLVCEGAGVGGKVDGVGTGANVLLMLTGMMKS